MENNDPPLPPLNAVLTWPLLGLCVFLALTSEGTERALYILSIVILFVTTFRAANISKAIIKLHANLNGLSAQFAESTKRFSARLTKCEDALKEVEKKVNDFSIPATIAPILPQKHSNGGIIIALLLAVVVGTGVWALLSARVSDPELSLRNVRSKASARSANLERTKHNAGKIDRSTQTIINTSGEPNAAQEKEEALNSVAPTQTQMEAEESDSQQSGPYARWKFSDDPSNNMISVTDPVSDQTTLQNPLDQRSLLDRSH